MIPFSSKAAMTKPQWNLFWRLWSIAAKAQGWTREAGLTSAEIDAKRHEVLAGCGFRSVLVVDKRDGFDVVKRKLELLADNLAAAVETVENEGDRNTGHERRLRWILATELLPQVAAMIGNPETYCAAILRDKFGADHTVIAELTDAPELRVKGTRTGETRIVENESRLQQLVNTLNTRVRAEAESAVMEMDAVRTRAGEIYKARMEYFHTLAGSPAPAKTAPKAAPAEAPKEYDPYAGAEPRAGKLGAVVVG